MNLSPRRVKYAFADSDAPKCDSSFPPSVTADRARRLAQHPGLVEAAVDAIPTKAAVQVLAIISNFALVEE